MVTTWGWFTKVLEGNLVSRRINQPQLSGKNSAPECMTAADKSSRGGQRGKMLTLFYYTVTQKQGTRKSHTWHTALFLICCVVTQTLCVCAFTILLVSFSFSTAKLTKKKRKKKTSSDPAGFPSTHPNQQHMEASQLINITTVHE